jgi:prepilin-type N-terminal cleavage/methylation domain-containing protein
MEDTMMFHRRQNCGFTLLELLIVIGMIGILLCLTTWGSASILQKWQTRRAAHQLLEDLKQAQSKAEMAGHRSVNNGALIVQRSFLVFARDARSYALHTWRDLNGDGLPTLNETTPSWEKTLPPGVAFGWTAGIDRKACSNNAGTPSSAISFASPNYPPCNDQPCIKFDHHGFSVIGPGAIYLQDNEHSLAITGTRPGHFTICEWDGERWK